MTEQSNDSHETIDMVPKVSARRKVESNFDGTPNERWRLSALATGPSCGKGDEWIGKEFQIRYWFRHWVDLAQEDGSTKSAQRTVLISPHGEMIGFVSDGVSNSLDLLRTYLGDGPYEQPVVVVIVQVKSKGGRKFLALEPAPERSETKPHGKVR